MQSRRQRGVTLTAEGLERLTFARREGEQRDREGRRFTHEELEAVTGLAMRTLSRVFEGSEPVDRRTLERAFGGFGLALRSTDYQARTDPTPPSSSRAHLPLESTSFLGREREVALLGIALSIGRLLTLCGPGGVGKTRLALRVAREQLPAFPDGVWFVDLSACAEQNALATTLAASFGLHDTASASAEHGLFRLLANKTALLVLDNCEHLREPIATLVQDLLHLCPSLRILATSREPLGVPAESVHGVAPLAIPPANMPLTLEGAREFDAVRFFEDRAAANGFTLSAQTLPTAREICRRLDGIPLALELVSAQLGTLGITDAARQLFVQLDLPHAALERLPARQKTLRASFEWSYALLADEERMLLRVLCVFAGGWSLEAATTIVRNLDLPVASVAGALARLEGKSLITRNDDDLGDRYTMLNVTRENLLAMFGPAEREPILRAHAEYFAGFATRVNSSAFATSQLLSTQRLDRESDELRSALRYTIADGKDVALGARIAIALTRWWLDRGSWAEGRRWLDLIRTRDEALDEATRAYVIYGNAMLATFQRDLDIAESGTMDALARFDALSDVEAFADALGTIGLLRRHLGRDDSVESFCDFRIFADAVAAAPASSEADPALSRALDLEHRGSEALLRVALQCYRATGTRRGEGIALQNLAVTMLELDDDLESATRLCARAAAVNREVHRERSVAGTHVVFSMLAASRGEYRDAIAHTEAALQIFVDFGNEPSAIDSIAFLGAYWSLEGDIGTASTYFREALERSSALAYDWGTLWSIEASARISAAIGETLLAIQLFGYAARRRETLIAVEAPIFETSWEASLAMLRRTTDPATFEEHWNAGRAWSESDAVAEAMRALDRSAVPILRGSEA